MFRLFTKHLLLFLFLSVPVSAFALDAEYYTWGGFDAVASGFQRLALIFSDGGYRGLFFSITVIAFALGGGAVVVRATTGVRVNPVSWLFPILAGVVIYLGLVVPTGTIHLYDEQTNKYVAIGGIPDGIVAIAGVLNLVERGMVEIISTAGDPRSYVYQAGGAGFLGLFEASSSVLTTDDTLMDTSINKYIEDCVSFELVRPGTTLTVDDFRRTTTDFREPLAKGDSPAIYTVYYDLTVPQGQTMTCQEAWVKINRYISDPVHLDENMKGICAQIGYDITEGGSFQLCKNSLQATLTDLGVAHATTDDFIRQSYLAQRLHDVYRSGDLDSISNYKFLLNSTGSMRAANEWLPIMKGVLTAVALGLVPFLALFIPTPLLGKAVGVMFGFFIWLTSWGVTDAILHQFLMDYGTRALEVLRQHGNGTGFGMDAFYFMPDETFKILGMFGTVRMSGLMLATVITGILVRFGGHALAMMGGSLMGQVQSAGQQGAAISEDPSGRAAAIKTNAVSLPTQTIANDNRYRYGGMMTEGLVNQTWGVEGAAARLQNMEALQGQGTLPAAPGRTGLGDFARQSQAMDKITTGSGIMGFGSLPGRVVSSDLRGEHTAMTTDARGWKVAANFMKDEQGRDTAGTLIRTGSAGSIKTRLGEGGEVIDLVELAGMTGKFGLGYREDAVRKGAHSMASEQTWNRVRQRVEEDSITFSEARTFKDVLANNVADEVGRSVEDGSAFRGVTAETQRKMLEIGASVGLGGAGKGLLSALSLGTVKINAAASGGYQLMGEEGNSVEFTASERETNALKTTASKLRESALAKTLQTSEGLKYASTLSSSDLGKEGYSYISEASTRDTASTTQDMELMTAYSMDRARRFYGSDSIEKVQLAVEDIAAAKNGPESQQYFLSRDIEDFISSRFRTLGKGTVDEVTLKEARASDGVGRIRPAAETAASSATAATRDNSYKDPNEKLEVPTDSATMRVENRKGAIDQIAADNGAVDFGSNPLKQLGRDISRPMVPQPDPPSARDLSGKPSSDVLATTPQTPEGLNNDPPEGISTVGGQPIQVEPFEMDAETRKKLENFLDGISRKN